MIEWKAVIIAFIMLVCYVLYLKIKSQSTSDAEPSNIDSNTKLLIDELHKLTQQHTNLQQFLFDTQQEKETTYNISYKTADNSTKTAEIIKAVDSTPYIQELTRQQMQGIEKRVNYLIKELNRPTPRLDAESQKALYKVTQTEIKEEQRSRKGESGIVYKLFSKVVGGVLKRKDFIE